MIEFFLALTIIFVIAIITTIFGISLYMLLVVWNVVLENKFRSWLRKFNE